MMRGSRKHVLDWTAQPEFREELIALLQPVPVNISVGAPWMPRGHSAPDEARLESFGPRVLPALSIWPALASWWLTHPAGANTPNWDLAVPATIDSRNGLVLIEAKANVPELSYAGKRLPTNASVRSSENHARIGAAIAEAAEALGGAEAGIHLSRDRSYQLSNRLAFAWRLAAWGVPVVLVYLGFTGDWSLADIGEPLRDAAHWRTLFSDHLLEVAPSTWLDQRIDTAAAPFWVLVRSRAVSADLAQAT
jgi:hypothetical protein